AVIWARAAHLFAQGEVPDEGVPHRFYAIAFLLHWFTGTARTPNFLWFKIAWCALSALGCATSYLVFVRNLPRRPAFIATGLCVFSFGSYVLATSLNVEGLYSPLLILILGGTLELARRRSWSWVLPLSVLNALALLAREEHLLLLLLLSGYVWWQWTSRSPGGPRSLAGALAGTLALLASRARMTLPAVTVVLGAIVLCLPYSVHATRATHRYNTHPKQTPNYDRGDVTWPADARAFIDSLPAFVRSKTVDLVTHRCRQLGMSTVTPEVAQQQLVEFFGSLPDRLSTPVFIASHGPMSFALSNHPDSNGGFSRTPLETRLRQDPRLNLSLPEHLRIFNHGYAVGWNYIRGDVVTWLGNVAKKLAHAYQGLSMGFTAYNLPLGRYGERRSCDLLTPAPGHGAIWQMLWGAVLLIGGMTAWRRSSAGAWLLTIAYKAAIVVVFYGYARQTVSILPAFFVIAAFGIDRVLTWVGQHLPNAGSFRVAQLRFAAVLVLGAGAADVHAATHPAAYQIVGPVHPLPEWGPQSFSSNANIHLRGADEP
ncbi:MAG: PCP reductase family protein, partial [Deltaproteobacteria bacterium]|nr:PCP reductase family protein [Deltaproteobacteria bacterium]